MMALSAVAPIHRLTVDDVLTMVRAGVLGEDDRVELVQGVLVDMSPTRPSHSEALELLTRWLIKAADDRVRIREQDMFLTDAGYLLPDVIVFEPLTDPRAEQPRTALLVIEVADTSGARDREKAADYAAAGVGEYWIVDLEQRAVVVHRGPSGGAYAEVVEHRDGDLRPPLDAPPLAVAELLGR